VISLCQGLARPAMPHSPWRPRCVAHLYKGARDTPKRRCVAVSARCVNTPTHRAPLRTTRSTATQEQLSKLRSLTRQIMPGHPLASDREVNLAEAASALYRGQTKED